MLYLELCPFSRIARPYSDLLILRAACDTELAQIKRGRIPLGKHWCDASQDSVTSMLAGAEDFIIRRSASKTSLRGASVEHSAACARQFQLLAETKSQTAFLGILTRFQGLWSVGSVCLCGCFFSLGGLFVRAPIKRALLFGVYIVIRAPDFGEPHIPCTVYTIYYMYHLRAPDLWQLPFVAVAGGGSLH